MSFLPTKERPIIFSGEMVRAILDGRKTQTRRVVKTEMGYCPELWQITFKKKDGKGYWLYPNAKEAVIADCPYGKPGDRLWVRETFACAFGPNRDEADTPENYKFLYKADSQPCDLTGAWKPSIHMPRKASRITLELTDIRVEPLQRITEADAVAEGIDRPWRPEGQALDYWRDYSTPQSRVSDIQGVINARASFKTLWDIINAKRGFGWEANPWVWVIGFKVLEGAND